MIETHELAPDRAAIIDGVCLMMLIDGKVEPEEVDFLVSMIQTLVEVDAEPAEALVQNSFARVQELAPEVYVEDVAVRLPERSMQLHLMTALQLASLSDGSGEENEWALLDIFAQRFGLEEDEIEQAIEQAREILAAVESAALDGTN